MLIECVCVHVLVCTCVFLADAVAQLGRCVLELVLIKPSRYIVPKQSIPPSTVLNSMCL